MMSGLFKTQLVKKFIAVHKTRSSNVFIRVPTLSRLSWIQPTYPKKHFPGAKFQVLMAASMNMTAL
jgi:hypothetical protein